MAKTKIPLTYTGSSTEDLYVLALRKGKEVKLRVKELNCHGGILAEGIAQDTTSYQDEDALKDAAEIPGQLTNGTVYTTTDENNNKVEYIYYNDKLSPLAGISDEPGTVVNGLEFGATYESLEKLMEAKNSNLLSTKKIYTVNDIGTIEQYILHKGKLVQIAGALNEIVSGSTDNESEVSSVTEDEDGVIDYNLNELKNGDYRYKNHSSLKEIYCDMPNLVSGVQMFYGTSLEHFCGSLYSLEDGTHMFSKGCKLDADSIYNILDGLKEVEFGGHQINIGYNSEKVTANQLVEMTAEFNQKGWNIIWHKDGSLSIQ